MFYVYMDTPCGTEFIGMATTKSAAEAIKAEQDAKWEPGLMWSTKITKQPVKETIYLN